MRQVLGSVVLVGLLTISGCNFGSNVSGKIVQNGKPITGANPTDTVSLSFVQTDGEKKAFSSSVNASDWTFKTATRVPAGKYMLRLSWYEDYNKVLEKNPKADIGTLPDKFKDEFAGKQSPLTVEITGDSTLTIDVGTKKVTKE